ncbi:hypothetical protein GF354_02810 [Candidatus Peregrinibacteria bacterium]|nr:hypothetical protein [Candidatus Peregrinibacteria bacterium]
MKKIINKITDLFHPFKKKKGLGLYVTDDYIQAVQLKKTRGNYSTEVVGQKPLPKKIIQNGEIINKDLFANELNYFLKEYKISCDNCILAIPEAHSFEHTFFLPSNLSNKQFKATLETLISETIPIPINNLYYSYKSFVRSKVSVTYVTAGNKEILRSYSEILKKFCNKSQVGFIPLSQSLYLNLTDEFNNDAGYILIDNCDTKTSYYSFWTDTVFDIGHILKSQENSLENFFKELSLSMNYFKQHTKRNIENILIFGEEQESIDLKNNLFSKFNIPITITKNYKIILENNLSYSFRIASGLAISCLDKKNNKNIIINIE